MKFLFLLSVTLSILLPLLPIEAQAAAPLRGAPRTVFVQLFEWPWNDIAEECETKLGPLGFAAVQVSPPNEHLAWQGSPWWERYQPISYKLISRSGTEEQFISMVRRCAAVGVDVYVDVVLNHMAGMHEGVGFAGTRFTQFEYPNLFTHKDFHHCGRNGNNNIKDFTDRYELQNCMLVNLADLDTGSERVQNIQAEYLNRLIRMGIRGFRIDAAKHISSEDLSKILKKVQGSPYILQELILSPGEPIRAEEYIPLGDINVFSYPYEVGRAFLERRLDRLLHVGNGNWVDSSHAVIFLDNHDLERRLEDPLLSFDNDERLYRLALVYMLTWTYGYPQVFSGYHVKNFDDGPPQGKDRFTLPILRNGECTSPWICQHRLPEVEALVGFRNRTNAQFSIPSFWSNGSTLIAFSRGNVGFVMINAGDKTVKAEGKTTLPPGDYCNLLASDYNPATRSCKLPNIRVGKDGYVSFDINALSAVVIEAK